MRIATTATRTIGAASSSFRITAVPAYHLAARAKSTSTATALDDKPGPSTSSTVRASAVESSDDYSSVIPQLPRPLGISIPPVSASKTYTKSRDSFHDAERSKAERKALMKEASHGYFHDYNRSRQGDKGKHWIAPKVLIREDKALWFPNIAGTDLTGTKTNTTEMLKGKVSLVSILNTRLSEEHIEAFIRPTLEDQEGNEQFHNVKINHQANPLKATLISFFTSALKRQVPQAEWRSYLLARGEWSAIDINGPMGIENKIVGYVYLVDKNCKIRWAGTGDPDEEEIESLRAATAVLLKRQEKA